MQLQRTPGVRTVANLVKEVRVVRSNSKQWRQRWQQRQHLRWKGSNQSQRWCCGVDLGDGCASSAAEQLFL